jgi:hypothetical protein
MVCEVRPSSTSRSTSTTYNVDTNTTLTIYLDKCIQVFTIRVYSLVGIQREDYELPGILSSERSRLTS